MSGESRTNQQKLLWAIAILFVLIYARTGIIHGAKFRLYVAVPDASNLLKGTAVWLNGQRIGTVASIHFAPPNYPSEIRVITGPENTMASRTAAMLSAGCSLNRMPTPRSPSARRPAAT